MKKSVCFFILASMLLSCKVKTSIEAKNEIMKTENEFSKMAGEKGLAEAFSYFASDSAVIRRGNDSLITGKESIRNFYKNSNPDARLSWTPDFIGVSECGTLGYTYGRFVFSVPDSTGKRVERTGIFHTVWRKENGKWRYVWD